MFKNLKIRQKFSLFLIVITVGPLLTVSYLSYSNSKYQLEQKIIDSFTALNNARAANINAMIQLRLEQARQLAGTVLTRQLDVAGDNQPWLIHKMQGHVDSIFNELKLSQEGSYENIGKPTNIESIGLVDINGKIIVNTDQSLIETHVSNEHMQMVKKTGTLFKGLERGKDTSSPYLVVLEEVRQWDTGEFAGAILLRFKGEILDDITTDRTGLGQTGETYIVNREGLMMTSSRFIQNAVVNLKIQTPAIDICFKGQSRSDTYRSYHETSVLGVYKYMPDQGWCMISEMDIREAFASVNHLRGKTLILIVAVGLLILIFMGVMNSIFIKPIVELRNASQQVGEGNLDVAVITKSKDELGELTEAFNQMVVHLREDKDKLEEQKKDLERVNEELDSFVYTASHDLRAPLRGIASFASFLEDDYKDQLDKEGKDHLKEIRQGADRLSALIEDLLELSRISRIKNPYEETDIKRTVEMVVEQLKYDIDEKKVELVIAENLPIIICDPIKIKTVFLNLVNNAIKFSSKKNKIQPRIEIGYNDKNTHHEFFVKDNGIGIDAEFHDKIFGLFRKLHPPKEYEGTGAGLSMVKAIIDTHEGKIHVESKEGEGAMFIFTIPKNLKISDQKQT